MKRTFHAFLLAVLTFAMASPSCAWFEKHPVIPAVVTCSGETIPLTLVTQVYNDVLAENWIDLTLNVVPLLKDGYADLECVFGYLKVSNPETVPHIEKLKAKHADEFKGSVSMRSPGDSTVPKGPTAVVVKVDSIGTIDAVSPREIPILSGDLALPVEPPVLMIVAQRSADLAAETMDCGSGMRSVTPMAPGVVCLRNGVTFTEALCKMKSAEAKPYPFTATFSGSGDPWAEAVIDLMHALPASACKAGPTALNARCQRACGGRDALAPPGDCLCLHENKRDQRQSHWVSLESSAVAAR